MTNSKSEPKFTPPPWHLSKASFGYRGIGASHTVGDKPCMGGGLQAICTVPYAGKEDQKYHEMFNANGHLIKASPNLYHALEDLLDAFDRLWSGFPLTYEENSIRKQIAQIALAEARGDEI